MSEVEVPAARRARRPGWRDPRILGGVAIMAVCVLAGGWLLGSHEPGRTVLVVTHDVAAGATVGGDDVAAKRVRLDGDLAEGYFTSTSQLPGGAHASHGLRAGNLLPRAALERDSDAGRLEVPLAIAPEDLPATVRAGSTVDVWVLPDHEHAALDGTAGARRVLSGVSVLRISGAGTALTPQDTRQVIVTLPGGAHGRQATLSRALATIAGGRVLITRRG